VRHSIHPYEMICVNGSAFANMLKWLKFKSCNLAQDYMRYKAAQILCD
jgi:hypothetical protein